MAGLEKIGVLAGSELIPKPVVYRRPTLLETGAYRRTVVIWVDPSQLTNILRMFTETAMFCHQKVDVGVYDPSDRYLQSPASIETRLRFFHVIFLFFTFS